MRALTELLDGAELVFDVRDVHIPVKRNDFPCEELTLAHVYCMTGGLAVPCFG
jgi:hypothetical protein